MAVETLSISGVRNLVETELSCHEGCNVLTGLNAAGKTSFLEAIHILGRARSFRAARLDRVRRNGDAPLRVFGQVHDGTRQHRLGVGRDGAGTRVRVDGTAAGSLSELAQWLPVQVINTESQRLLQEGPEARRSYINWTVFHVEHEYHGVWRRFDRALKQRNAALREQSYRLVQALEGELVTAAERVDTLRRRVLDGVAAAVVARARDWLPGVALELRYRPGWAEARGLGESLERQRESERSMGYTMAGPHRADLRIMADGMEARHRLSRGQQKVLVIALLLAQAECVAAGRGPRPVLLVDDLPAEMDAGHLGVVVEALRASAGQCFFTAIDSGALPIGEARWFHVEQGTITEMV